MHMNPLSGGSGGFTARLCRFFPKGLKNPAAVNIRICNPIKTHYKC